MFCMGYEAELIIYRQLQIEIYLKSSENLRLVPVHPKEKIASLQLEWDSRDKLIRISYVFRQYFPLRRSSFDVSTIRSRIHVLLARRNLLWIISGILAPWWGGFLERMVRSVKDLIIRTGQLPVKREIRPTNLP